MMINDDAEMELLGKQYHHQVEGSFAYLSTLYQQHEEIEEIELYSPRLHGILLNNLRWSIHLDTLPQHLKGQKQNQRLLHTNMSMEGPNEVSPLDIKINMCLLVSYRKEDSICCGTKT